MRYVITTPEHEHTFRAARAAEELMPGWKSEISKDGLRWRLTSGIWTLRVRENGSWVCFGAILGTGRTPHDAVADAAHKLTARYSQDMEALTGKKL